MRRRNELANNALYWERQSLWWNPDYDYSTTQKDLYLDMFAKDVSLELYNHFFNQSNRSDKNDIENVRIENCSNKLEITLVDSIAQFNYISSVSEIFGHFADYVSQQIILEDNFVFEICLGWDKKDSPHQLKSVNLTPLPPHSIIKMGPYYFQIIPSNIRNDSKEEKTILLNEERIVIYEPPSIWRAPLKKMRRDLKRYSVLEGIRLQQMANGKRTESIKTTDKGYKIALAHITAPVGWNARASFLEYTADYHHFYRELKFIEFCIDIRESILQTTSELFIRIGKLFGEEPRLVWENMPTHQQVSDCRVEMMELGSSFDKIIKRFYYNH